MAAMQCSSCGGTYASPSADGVPYFHACPPVVQVPVTRAGVAQLVALPDVRPDDVVTVTRAGKVQAVTVADVQDGDTRAPSVTAPRPNARDENVMIVKVGGVAQAVPKAAGLGAVVIAAGV